MTTACPEGRRKYILLRVELCVMFTLLLNELYVQHKTVRADAIQRGQPPWPQTERQRCTYKHSKAMWLFAAGRPYGLVRDYVGGY